MTCVLRSAALLALWVVVISATTARGDDPSAGEKRPAEKPTTQPSAKARVLVTISKETTYITEPLRKDGYPDYIAALNQRASEGVTPENNAAVLFWKAMGPRELQPQEREKFFKMLGIPPLAEKGDYYIPLETYLKERKQAELPAGAEKQQFKKDQDKASEQLDLAMKRPWSKQEFPLLADWLAANEKPLGLLAEASKRPRRYDPMYCGGEEMAIGILLPGVQQYRDAARILVARAMLRIGEGKVNEAWEDLLTCHRLARLAGQGVFLIDALVAVAIDTMAFVGDQALLQSGHPSAAQVVKMRDSLANLPPMSKMVDKIDYAERFVFLDIVSLAARNGLSSITSVVTGAYRNTTPKSAFDSFLDSLGATAVDWDLVLRMGNSWYVRLADAFRKPTRSERKAALDRIDEDIRKQMQAARDWKSLPLSMLGNPQRTVSERVGQVLVVLLLPGVSACANAEDRGTMQFELTKLAFALAAYHVDNASYPAKLADLTPKYVAEVPKDIFADAELHYTREGDGYLLYSVGVNGKDDGGKSYDDAKAGEDWDDLVVRISAAK